MFDEERFLDPEDVFGTERSGTVVAQAYSIPVSSNLQTLAASYGKRSVLSLGSASWQ